MDTVDIHPMLTAEMVDPRMGLDYVIPSRCELDLEKIRDGHPRWEGSPRCCQGLSCEDFGLGVRRHLSVVKEICLERTSFIGCGKLGLVEGGADAKMIEGLDESDGRGHTGQYDASRRQ